MGIMRIGRIVSGLAFALVASVGVAVSAPEPAEAFCLNVNVAANASARNAKESVRWATCDDDGVYWGKHMDNAPGNGHCIYIEHDVGPWWASNSRFWNCRDRVWINYTYFEADASNKFRLCEPNGLGCSGWLMNKGF